MCMAKLSITRCASDNVYLHKDFHGALSSGIAYLHQRYGEDAVHRYLRQFAKTYYAPLTHALQERGLSAMREHLERIYAIEGGEIAIEGDEDQLIVHVTACPAVTHMHEHGYPVARLFSATSSTVYAAICEKTPFAVDVLSYDEQTGASTVRFYRRTA